MSLSRHEWWALSFIGCALLVSFALIWLAASVGGH